MGGSISRAVTALVGIDARLDGDVVAAEEPGDLEEAVVAVRQTGIVRAGGHGSPSGPR